MMAQAHTKTQNKKTAVNNNSRLLIQRKCSCGSHSKLSGQCDNCEKEKLLGVQPKLSIGLANDKYEQEADRVANQVMSRSSHSGIESAPIRIQRISGHSSSRSDSQASANVDRVLAESGSPLKPVLRHDMEQRFGHDFSQVRVHTGQKAEQSAKEINAHAYTAGHHVVFGSGKFTPETNGGKRLIAHELTHVIQQKKGSFNSPQAVQRKKASTQKEVNGGLSEEMLRDIAYILYKAMDGWGTDEEAIYSAFSGRTQEQVDAIEQTYHKIYKVKLIDELRSELNNSEMKHLGIFSPTAVDDKLSSDERSKSQSDMVAYQLNKAMKGLGTDERSIYSALTGRTETELIAIKQAYNRLTSRELETDIRDEMSGSELLYALDLLNQGKKQAKIHLFTDIDVKSLGFSDLVKGNVGHTWVSLEYKDPLNVPMGVHPSHKSLLKTGGIYSDPMGFWPAINEGIGFSVNPFNSWVKGWMRHPDRAHQGNEKATQSWEISNSAVETVIKYAESKRKAKYSVYSYNCTTFAKEAIEATGKSPPSMTSFGFAMPNAVYDGIIERQKKKVGRTSVKDFDTKIETNVNGLDERNKHR